MKKTAIILGASGLTGSFLLEQLITDQRYACIKLFSRTALDHMPKQVKQYTGDLLELNKFKSDFTGDEVFCCIGTTTKKTPDKTQYKAIDFGIPVAAAKLAKANGIPTFLVVSAMGANSNSSVFYNKTKGDMEEAVLQQAIENTYILRPSIIDGNRNEHRILERMGLNIMKLLKPFFFGKLLDYAPIHAQDIAKVMHYLANNKQKDKHILESNNIKKLAKK